MIIIHIIITWEQRKLEDFGSFTGGTSIESEFEENGKYKVISIGSYSETSKYNDQGIRCILSEKTVNKILNKDDLTMILNDKTASGNIIGRVLIIDKSGEYVYNQRTERIEPNIQEYYPQFLYHMLNAPNIRKKIIKQSQGNTQIFVNWTGIQKLEYLVPKMNEQINLAKLIGNLDNIITLHQRNNKEREGDNMDTYNGNELFYKYYEKWIKIYKEGAIRNSTMNKYKLSLKWLKKIAPKLKTKEVNRITYQEILNEYAENHERQSTMDFHHQLKSSILDAVDDGLIEKNPTRKAIIKGKMPTREKKEKFLNQFELQKLLSVLKLEDSINNDWLIYLIAKTGLRFSEALGLTPKDFDFEHQLLCVDKTWNYKEGYGFEATKNKSSTRKIQLDWQTIIQFSRLIKDKEENKPIFINSKIYNSTINEILARHCKEADIPIISIHGLRHTHASLLLYSGVSVSSVAHRLGHASMTTTQKTYLHIIQELENTDLDKIMRTLASLNN